ncbi:putative High osmolarity glycerol pathway protein Nbp2 [Arthroderma uncinatum]|uniref:putative High osmolarity glycerol pathway protein Nbp2 n=1 Tax=Arthroderma uncinatum TaxID=74035 RepID=UPI00144A7B18|nr:putative High osmolarity glycerol pathway protein Nbp2 [Arthroderma uncinatum]KAF3483908.1 putative High osmolarity glycerol pathway protein Nbp2 [Arthroderma uncinatum]
MMATAMASSQSPPQFDTSTPPPISARASLASSTTKRSSLQRPSSYAKNRLSVHSNKSNSQNRSRPTSTISNTFSVYQSSLPYAIVRDFAYPPSHPLHYGAPPKDSGISTPVHESRRISDAPLSSLDATRSHWPAPNWDPGTMYSQQQLPPIAFGDGPPYSEDEDLHSPVVTTSRHRKNKSGHSSESRPGSRRRKGSGFGVDADNAIDAERGVLIGVNGDGSETYYVRDDDADEDGPGGEYVTYPAGDSRRSYHPGFGDQGAVGGSGLGNSLHNHGSYDRDFELASDDDISDDDAWHDPSRYSRDYQFTIVSPDEEMHGKAVALFDFTREHENELPLKEGQVILVSYRHGQGWLVAEDPRTGESGLVPEEFVRLVRDIEGGLNSLNGDLNMVDANLAGSETEQTPTATTLPTSQLNDAHISGTTDEGEAQANTHADIEVTDSGTQEMDTSAAQIKETEKDKAREKHPPIVSTFSTSSRDLNPYPPHLLSGHQHSRSMPPPIEHSEAQLARSASGAAKRTKSVSKRASEST